MTDPATSYTRPAFRRDFQIAIICALPLEYDAAALLIDEFWDVNGKQYGRADGDKNMYRNGRVGAHNVVLMLLPSMGTAAVAGSAASLRTSYPALQVAFLIGICGGSPTVQEALLGDVVIGDGVIQYLLGRQYPNGFVTKSANEGNVHAPNREIRGLIAYFKTETGRRELQDESVHHLRSLQEMAEEKGYNSSYRYPGVAEDKLFEAKYPHKHRGMSLCDICSEETELCDEATHVSCAELGCDELYLVRRAQLAVHGDPIAPRNNLHEPKVLIGRIGSGDTVMKSAIHRDQIAKQHNIVAFEMEGAGLWDEIPSIIIKGICDYSDSHKNKAWQPYAAATAAAVTKVLLGRYSLNDDAEGPTSSMPVGATNESPNVETDLQRGFTKKRPYSGQTMTSSYVSNGKRPPDPRRSLEKSIFGFQYVLDDTQRHEIQSSQVVPACDEVLIFTAELDSLNRDRRGPSVASRLFSVLQSVRDFSNIVDTMSLSPLRLSFLVWGSFRTTILLAFNSSAFYEEFCKIFMEIGKLCPLSRQYYKLYADSSQLQQSLCNFFASLIECCKQVVQAIKQHPQGYLARFQNPTLSGLSPQIRDIERCSAQYKQDLSLSIMIFDHLREEEEQEKQPRRTMSSKVFRRVSSKVEKTRGSQWDSQEATKVAKHRKTVQKEELLESLSSHDFLTPLKQSRRKKQSGTAEWLFKTEQFEKWINGHGRPVFWYSGKIGSGKTILTASVIDKILTTQQEADTVISFFFVQFDSQNSLQSANILKSIIKQALSKTEVSSDIEVALDGIRRELPTQPQEIVKVLEMVAEKFRTFYIVIDGLDECEKQERVDLLESLSSLTANFPNILIFIASRDSISDDIKRSFSHMHYHQSTGTLDAQSEIAIYVESSIEERLRMEDLNVGDQSLINEIKTALIDGADGMFLWVAFQIKELCSRHCDDEIRKAIRDLPRGLTETFNRALRRIASRQHTYIARQCFHWIAAARRPLTLAELREAVSVDIGETHSRADRLVNDMHLISSWCENLVIFDEDEDIVQFAHHTVQGFFVANNSDPDLKLFHFDLDEADHFVGEIIVTYLNFTDFQTALAKVPKSANPRKPQQPKPRILPSDIARNALRSGWKSKAPLNAIKKLLPGSETKVSLYDFIENMPSFQEDLIAPRIELQRDHPFLVYASNHWLHHSRGFKQSMTETWDIWENMVQYGHDLAEFPWTPKSLQACFIAPESSPSYDPEDDPVQYLFDKHAPLKWAFTHNHEALKQLIYRYQWYQAAYPRT